MKNDRLPIVVVGLSRRHDRRAAIEARLSSISSLDYRFAADLALMADWREWDDDQRETLRAKCFPWRDASASRKWWNRDLRLGEIACTLSHWNVWTRAATEGVDTVIVLEDDALPLPAFANCAAVLADLTRIDPEWGLLYLGRGRMTPDRGTVGRFVLPGFGYGAFGYAVSRRGLQALLHTDLQNAIIPVDEFIPAMCFEHPRLDVRVRFPPSLAGYGLASDIVLEPSQNLDSDTEDSPFLV